MDQTFQLALSLVAIFLLALLAKIYWPKPWTLDKDRVKRAFERSDYGVNIREICLDASNTAALAQLEEPDAIGYAFSFGDRVTCRRLTADDIKSIHHKDNHLNITFNDYTLNSRAFGFADRASCQAAMEVLAALKLGDKVHV